MGGGKNARKKFSKITRIGYPKIFEKKRLKKVRKMFFNKQMNIETLNGGKKSEKKILPETHVYRVQKTMEKNRMEKAQKHVFFINTRIL